MALQGVLPNKCFQDIPNFPEIIKYRGAWLFNNIPVGETDETEMSLQSISTDDLRNSVVMITPVIMPDGVFYPNVQFYAYINYSQNKLIIGAKNNGQETAEGVEINFILV